MNSLTVWVVVEGGVGRCAAFSLVSVSLGSGVDLDSVVSEGVVLESVVHQSVGL